MDINKQKRIWELHKKQLKERTTRNTNKKKRKKNISVKQKKISNTTKGQTTINYKLGLSNEQIQDSLRHQAMINKINSNSLNNKMKKVTVERHGEIYVTPHVYDLIQKDREEQCPQRTPAWYAKRNNHVTASMVASVCNDNPYDSRASAIKKKTGAAEPFKGNAATAHGNLYEQEAIEKYEAATGQKAIEFGLLESLNEGEEFLAGR